MKPRILSLVLVAALARNAGPQDRAATPQPPAAAPQPPAFPAHVEQVTVDVVVTDGKGHPVPDLTRNDLEVYEDGVRQAIASFDVFRAPAQAAPPPGAAPTPPPSASPVSVNTEGAARAGRTFVIVFDDVHLRARTAQMAKVAVAEFLRKEAREGDTVTLLATSGTTWWTARMEAGREEMLALLKRLEGKILPETRRDWLSDYEAMRIYIFHDNMIIDRVQRRFATYNVQTVTELDKHSTDLMPVEDPVVTSRAAEVYYESSARNHQTLGVMERAIKSLAPARGRKSVVLLSEGFVYDSQLPEFKRINDAARRVNATIYFVNGRGLEGLPDALSAEYSTILPEEDLGAAIAQTVEMTEGAEGMASDSGGFTVRNSNDLSAGLKRISDETRVYYLVGYNPTNTARDGAFRKIEVKVRGRRGLQVRARKGYYAPSDTAAPAPVRPGTDPVFQTALDSPYELEDIPLRLTHYVRDETSLDRARVFLAAEVDVRRLDLEEKEGKAVGSLQYLMVAVQRDGGPYFRVDHTLDLALPSEDREELARTWLPVVNEFELPVGRYRAKVVVRDKTSGKLGTVIHDFEVPDLKPFRVSTPVLSDVREVTEAGTPGDRLGILARRDFAQGASLFCQLEVYRAVKDEKSGMPKVSMGYEVRRSDGTVLMRDAPSLINPASDGALSRMIGIPLGSASPGDYELVMRVKDEYSGDRVELREPFHVTAAVAPAATGE